MKYNVLWRPAAIELLSANYESLRDEGRDTAAITRAAVRLDLLLQHEPGNRGESRNGNERVLIEAPLTVFFEVFEAEHVVSVLFVHHVRRR